MHMHANTRNFCPAENSVRHNHHGYDNLSCLPVNDHPCQHGALCTRLAGPLDSPDATRLSCTTQNPR